MELQLTYKRFVLLAGRIGRQVASMVGLTPQRTDLLFLLRAGEVAQRDLAKALCVCPAVVSKMVTALERLGLVARRIPPNDRRLRLVAMTNAARQVLGPLYDGWIADSDCACVQHVAEMEALYRFPESVDEVAAAHSLVQYDDQKQEILALRARVLAYDFFMETIHTPAALIAEYGERELRRILREASRSKAAMAATGARPPLHPRPSEAPS